MTSPFLSWRVVDIVDETPDARTFVLEPADGGELPAYRPGQFLTFAVPTDRPEQAQGVARSYSLCSRPGDAQAAVTVKRVPGGWASHLLHERVRVGDRLTSLRPAGTFVPSGVDEDVLLVAAGSGITPVLSILRAVLETGRGRVALLYANRDEESVIFAARLRELSAQFGGRLTVVHWLESVQGVPSAAAWSGLVEPYAGRPAFVCGPGAFMAMVTSVLSGLGVASERVRVEEFVSLSDDPFAALRALTAGGSEAGVVAGLGAAGAGAGSGAGSGGETGAGSAAGSGAAGAGAGSEASLGTGPEAASGAAGAGAGSEAAGEGAAGEGAGSGGETAYGGDAGVAEVEVTLDGEVTTLRWPGGALLLDVMLAAGLAAPWSCREGKCSTCACYVREGSVELVHNEVLDAADLRDGLILACQARPTSARVAVSYDA